MSLDNLLHITKKIEYIEKSYRMRLLDLVVDGIKSIIAGVIYVLINIALLKKLSTINWI